MDPFVSPWLIYLISVIGNIQKLLLIIGTIFGFISASYFFFYILDDIDTDYCITPQILDDIGKIKSEKFKKIKKYFILCIIFLVIGFLIPSRETLIAMLVANIITPDNINGTNEFIKSNVQDYVNIIVEGINKIK